MLWPFCPLTPMTEGVEFVTDVMRAFSEEQRVRLRAVARRRFEASYVFDAREYERARLSMRGTLPGPFDVPDWTDVRRTVAAATDNSLSFDNNNPQFTAAMDLIILQDSETYEVLSVSGSTSGGLTLSVPLVNDYPNGRVLRLLECDAPGGFTAEHPAGPYRSADVEWVCYDDDLPTADESQFGTYRTEPLLDDCPLVGDDALPESVQRLYQTVDNFIARPFVDSARGQPSEVLGLAWQPASRAERWSLRRHLLALRGRQRAFWLPSFNTGGLELAATATAGAGSITIREVNLGIGYPDGELDIYLLTTSGTVITRQVTAITPGVGTEVLTITPTWPTTVTPAAVHRFHILTRMRLAQDRVEWLHRAASGPKVVVAAHEAPLPA